MIIAIILFIIGLIALTKGSDWLIDGASSIAKKTNISDLVIGLTVVAFGTSAPELVVSITSSLKGSADIAIGNVIGSNIANIFLILGVTALVYPIIVNEGTIWKEIPLSLLAVVLVGIMANDAIFDGMNFSSLTRTNGLSLIAFFVIFIYYILSVIKGQEKRESMEDGFVTELSLKKSIIFVIVGLTGLIIGGKLVVDAAVEIAARFGVSESLIGLTIVAIGTSLPELATSVMAAYKKRSDIAIGNVVGSNIFNVFLILGVSSTINPLPFNVKNNFDVIVAIIASSLLFFMMFIGKKHYIERRDGFVYLVLYFAYIVFLVNRG